MDLALKKDPAAAKRYPNVRVYIGAAESYFFPRFPRNSFACTRTGSRLRKTFCTASGNSPAYRFQGRPTWSPRRRRRPRPAASACLRQVRPHLHVGTCFPADWRRQNVRPSRSFIPLAKTKAQRAKPSRPAHVVKSSTGTSRYVKRVTRRKNLGRAYLLPEDPRELSQKQIWPALAKKKYRCAIREIHNREPNRFSCNLALWNQPSPGDEEHLWW